MYGVDSPAQSAYKRRIPLLVASGPEITGHARPAYRLIDRPSL